MDKNKIYHLDDDGEGAERVKAHDYADVYSNQVDFVLTDRDVRMTFGHFLGLEEGRLRIKQQISIVMNAEQAREFSRQLSEALRAYETEGQNTGGRSGERIKA